MLIRLGSAVSMKGLWSPGGCLQLITAGACRLRRWACLVSALPLVPPRGLSPHPSSPQHVAWPLVTGRQAEIRSSSPCHALLGGFHVTEGARWERWFGRSVTFQVVFPGQTPTADRERPEQTCSGLRWQLGAAPLAWGSVDRRRGPSRSFPECLRYLNSPTWQTLSCRDFSQYFSFYRDSLFSLFIETSLPLSPILEETDTLSSGGLKKRLSCFPLGRFILVG